MFEIDNYTSYNSVRKNRVGAGISIYILNSICANMNYEFSDNNNNFVIVYLRKLNLKIFAAYNTHNETFLGKLEEILASNKNCIILGDINIDILKNNTQTKNYKDIIISNGYHIINKIKKKYATRIANNTKTIIDHAITDLYNYKHHLLINSHNFTDHESLTLQIKIEKFKSASNKISYKQVTNIRKFSNEFVSATDNINLNTTNFTQYHEMMSNAIKNNTQTKTIKTKYNNKLPYINNEIKVKIELRNKLYVIYKKNVDNNIIKNQFIKIRNTITKEIRKARKNYDKKQLTKCNGDNRKIWNFLNNCVYNRQENNKTNPLLMQKADKTNTTDLKEMCEILNSNFISAGNLFLNDCQIITNEPLIINFRPMQPSITYFSFNLIDKIKVYNTIYKLKENTAPGYDLITVKIIKHFIPTHIEQYTKYINNIILTSKFPNELKIAKILPIYKSGNKELPENYRPIAILPSFAKIIESIIYDQFMTFLKDTAFFNKNQYGFISESGTLTAGINLIQCIQESLDKNKHTATLFVDLRKAFETVQHEILITKLQKININYDAIALIKDFLNNRKQQVYINNTNSKIKNIKCGVPQGSKLAALFYIIFINDIFETRFHGNIQLYADDIAITYSCNSVDILKTKMQDDIFKLKTYLDKNKLIINVKKTNYIIYRARDTVNFTLFYDNQLINKTNVVKYLGLIINEKLNWNNHLESISNQITPFIGAIKRIAYRLPVNLLKNLYFAFIQSKLSYMIPIWGTCPKYKLNKLKTLQNKAIKIVLKKPRLTPTTELYNDMFTPISNILFYNQCLYIYQTKNEMMRSNIEYRTNTEVHGYRTRNGNNLHTKLTRSNTGANSVANAAIKEFNKLIEDIRSERNINKFKIKLKKHLYINTQIT